MFKRQEAGTKFIAEFINGEVLFLTYTYKL